MRIISARLRAFVALAESLRHRGRSRFLQRHVRRLLAADALVPWQQRPGVGNYEAGNSPVVHHRRSPQRRRARPTSRPTSARSRPNSTPSTTSSTTSATSRPSSGSRTARSGRGSCAPSDAFLEAETTVAKKHLLGQTVQSSSPDFSGRCLVRLAAHGICRLLPTPPFDRERRREQADHECRIGLLRIRIDQALHRRRRSRRGMVVHAGGWCWLYQPERRLLPRTRDRRIRHPDRIVPERKILRDFMESLDLAGLARFTGVGGVPTDAFANCSWVCWRALCALSVPQQKRRPVGPALLL